VHLNQEVKLTLRPLLMRVLTALLMLQLAGCSVGYYWQAARGQMRIVNGREDIDVLLEDASVQPELRARLELSAAALDFAHGELELPDNGSYRSYYDTGSDYVVWNVFAAPEFSLEPLNWCFPVAGCVSYRGYFAADKARKYADKLAAKGNDIYVAGVPAYSTLGRFEDPVLNTMLEMSDEQFAGLLFHELAHQRLYAQDDTAFNEGFAAAVEQIGLTRWRPAADIAAEDKYRQQLETVVELLKETRERLDSLYVENQVAAEMRAAKAAIISAATNEYRLLVVEWQLAGLGYRPYEHMMKHGLNNASLSALATYANYLPAFMAIYSDCQKVMSCFYGRAEELAGLDSAERREQLAALMSTP
jgi:predicted aminopeptidase